ncbi:MAG TPA: magnesium transporter [Vicinamibacterales bacterium]|nr:magnesium transporter [Vicinamibacterales bacterium]
MSSSRYFRDLLMAQRKLDVVLDSVKRLLRMGATANLVNLLQKQHPADLAQLFSELPDKDRHAAFSLLVERNSRLAMEGLSELGPEAGAALLADRSPEEIVKLTQELPSDDAAAIIDYLPEELSTAVLELIQKRPAGGEVGELLEYAEQTAGRIMNPKVFALAEDMTAGEAITALQGSRDVEVVFYLYVIDSRRHLVGVVSLRRLLLVPPATPLKRIMTTDLISVRSDMDQEEVARQVASYNLLAIPVVDEENKLVGVITVDDVIDVIKDEATEDVYRLAGVSSDDRVFTRPSESLKKRLPWLMVNLVTAFVAASVVAIFEDTIGILPVLAVLMPIVAGMGGNAATQTLTVIVRGIALGELTWANTRKALLKEAAVGIGNGVACGVLAAVIVLLYKGDPVLGLVLGMAMIINMFVAATAGTLIPLLLRALKVDPALASSVFITTLTDMFGFFSFLGLAYLFINHLHLGG